MGSDNFKLPTSSLDEINKIIQAYASSANLASLDDLTKLTAMPSTSISGNHKFLVSVGLIEGGREKSATELGRELGRALEYNILETIASCWRKIATRHDFFDKLKSAIKIRGGMDRSSLQAHIAFSAGAPKTHRNLTGAGAVIDILLEAGVLNDKDGTVHVSQLHPSESPGETTEDSMKSGHTSGEREIGTFSLARGSAKSSAVNNLSINLNINIDCKIDDMEKIQDSLTALFESIENNKKPTKE